MIFDQCIKLKKLLLPIICLLHFSCNSKPELNRYFDYVIKQSEVIEIQNYKSIPEDSIFHIHSENIPSFISETLNTYPYESELKAELNTRFNIKSRTINREVMMILFHLSLNNRSLSIQNLERHWDLYNATFEQLDLLDSLKLNQFIARNYEGINIGDQIKLILEVEELEDGYREMTYGSVYDMYNPKTIFEDSLIIQGELIRKGNYPEFDLVDVINYQGSSLMFEIRMTEISDTSLSIEFKGPTENLRLGELFYVSLEGYGCREIIKLND